MIHITVSKKLEEDNINKASQALIINQDAKDKPGDVWELQSMFQIDH